MSISKEAEMAKELLEVFPQLGLLEALQVVVQIRKNNLYKKAHGRGGSMEGIKSALQDVSESLDGISLSIDALTDDEPEDGRMYYSGSENAPNVLERIQQIRDLMDDFIGRYYLTEKPREGNYFNLFSQLKRELDNDDTEEMTIEKVEKVTQFFEELKDRIGMVELISLQENIRFVDEWKKFKAAQEVSGDEPQADTQP